MKHLAIVAFTGTGDAIRAVVKERRVIMPQSERHLKMMAKMGAEFGPYFEAMTKAELIQYLEDGGMRTTGLNMMNEKQLQICCHQLRKRDNLP